MKRFLRLKTSLLFLMAAALFLGLAVFPSAETVTGWSLSASLESGSYALVVTTVAPYYVSTDPVNSTQYPGFEAAAADLSSPDGVKCWEIERISASKCTLRNLKLGANGYLNVSPDALQYGPRQELNYEASGNGFKFYRTVGGKKYYIRITTQNGRRFHGGTGESSNVVRLYRSDTYEQTYRDNAALPAPEGEPFLTIACVSDLHTDWEMQNKPPYVRNSTYNALTRMGKEDKADLVLIGGDSVSDNARQSEYAWPKMAYNRVLKQYDTLMKGIAPRQIWACGNHDYEVGVDEGYDSYAGFETLMNASNGPALSVYRQKDDPTLSDQRYPDALMGIHYRLYAMDFIVLNPPYAQNGLYSAGALNWFRQRMASVGKEKTVFLVTHYPLSGFRMPASSGINGSSVETLRSILLNYPNLIYLYGHIHNGNGCYIGDDVFEQISSFTPGGVVLNDRNAVPTSFIASFMGSMSYSKHDITPGYLNEKDSDIVQALMIYLYKDRIVFTMKNYGAHPSNADKVLKSWTVLRDLSAYAPSSGGDSGFSDSTDEMGEATSLPPSDEEVSVPSTDKVTDSDDPVTDEISDEASDGASDGFADSDVSTLSVPSGSTSDLSGDEPGAPPTDVPSDPGRTPSGETFPKAALIVILGILGAVAVGTAVLLFFLWCKIRRMAPPSSK